MRVLSIGLLISSAVISSACTKNVAPPQVASRDAQVLTYSGEIRESGVAQLKAALGTHSMLVITSNGGSVAAGIDLGEWVLEKGLSVVVDKYCMGPCASYVFPAGKVKSITPGSVVGWIASPNTPAAEGSIAEYAKDEVQEAQMQAYLAALGTREVAFYQRIGVNPCLPRLREFAGGTYTMSVTDMERYGLQGITTGPHSEEEISPEWRKRFNLKFYHPVTLTCAVTTAS